MYLTAPVNLTLIAATCGGYNDVRFAWKGGAQREFTTSAAPFFRPASRHKLGDDLTCGSGCPPGWIRLFGRCFVVPAMEAKADLAAEHCRRLGLRCKIRYRILVRAKSSNFRRLVLGCIGTDFCNQILIFQHFSRSTRLTFFCTAQTSKFQQKKPSQCRQC